MCYDKTRVPRKTVGPFLEEISTIQEWDFDQRTHQEESDARNHTANVVLLHESNQVSVLAISNEIPEMCQCIQKIAHSWVIVRLAIVGREPAAGARCEECSVCPPVWVNRMDQNDIALFDCYSDGGFVCRGGDGGGRVVVVEGAQVVMKYRLWAHRWCHDLT